MDGVLLDSVPLHYAAWQKTFADEGVVLDFDTYLEKVNGQPRSAGVSQVMPHLSPAEVMRVAENKQRYIRLLFSQTPPSVMPGVRELLTLLSSQGITLACASSSKNAPTMLTLTQIDGYFSAIISGHNVTRPKPDPQIFLLAANALDVDPADCVVIEDSIAGVRAAHKAGMYVIGLNTSKDAQVRQEASHHAEDLAHYEDIYTHILALSS